jgi:hypothetical protein
MIPLESLIMTIKVAVMVFLDHGIMGQNVGEVAASLGQNVGA